MKTLYESILDIDKNHDNDVLINLLFSNDIQQRRVAFDNLHSIVKSHHPKPIKTTSKMKNSDSYFVEFTYPFKVENGEATEILDWISYIQICKRIGSFYIIYRTVCINASEDSWGDKISVHELNWGRTQPNFNPGGSNTELYEVPEELNELFEQIQTEASKHK